MTPQDLIGQIETEILQEIAKNLKTGAVLSADWKIEKLRKLGSLNAVALKLVKRYSQQVVAGTLSEIEKAAYQIIIKSDIMFSVAQKAGATLLEVLPPETCPEIKSIITAWQEIAGNQVNLCLTTLLQNMPALYIQTINSVTAQVLTGVISGQEAMRRAIKNWADEGIPSIVDKAGRHWTTEAYANMVIRTNTTNVAHQVQDQRIQQYGADLIEVSSHAGARPLCAPYQGRIFSLSGKTYPEGYAAVSSIESYGKGGGLFSYNCGHSKYPFWPGISTQTYKPMGDEEHNAELYKESQDQRKIERSIRAAKRRLAIFESKGDDKEAIAQSKELVREKQKNMRDFIEETGRTRQRNREQVFD